MQVVTFHKGQVVLLHVDNTFDAIRDTMGAKASSSVHIYVIEAKNNIITKYSATDASDVYVPTHAFESPVDAFISIFGL